MAVPFPIPPLLLAIMGGAFLFVLAGLSVVPPLATGVRQAGYERAVRRELVRLEVILPANVELDADATAELIRALHPGQRRGVDRFRVGWPPIELRLAWRGGSMHWQIDCPAQVVASVEMAVRSVLGRCELEEVALDDPVPSAVATARLARAATRSLRPDATSASSVPLRLAVALDQAGTGVQVVLRIRLMPGAANDPDEEGIGRSIGGFLVSTIIDALLFRETADTRPSNPAPARSTELPTGMYSATIALEASGAKPAAGAALLWKLVGATDALRSGPQSLVWTVREGSKSGSSALSADPELLGALVGAARPALRRVGARSRTIAARFAPRARGGVGDRDRGCPPRSARPLDRHPRSPSRGLRRDRFGQDHAPAQSRARLRPSWSRGERDRPSWRSDRRHPRPAARTRRTHGPCPAPGRSGSSARLQLPRAPRRRRRAARGLASS